MYHMKYGMNYDSAQMVPDDEYCLKKKVANRCVRDDCSIIGSMICVRKLF